MIGDSQRIYRRISDIINLSKQLNDDDLLKQSVAAHVCILQSGLLENIVKESLKIYADKRAEPCISRFVCRRLKELQNPKAEKIENILSEFSPELKDDLRKFWCKNGIRDHVDSVVANRHLIAHGQSFEVSMSRVSDWHRSIKRVMDFFEEKFRQ
jgi:hypothetical protein